MAKPLHTASGDNLADRRADYAEMLFAESAYAASAEIMLGALELAPDWAMGWFRLGEMQQAAGSNGLAAQAWRVALKLEPADRLGAGLKLELVGAAPASSSPPSVFVETLYDFYAEKFESELVGKLEYRVPEILAGRISALGRPRFGMAIDLGCGTGLMGERLRPMTERLEGYDISAAMLRKAADKGFYDRLTKADLQTLDYAGPKADLVVASDVFIYIGALEGIVKTVASMLAGDGVFAFTVEKHEGPEAFALLASRRYAHSEAYVRKVLAANGFSVAYLETTVIRQDRREPIEGLIAVATTTSAGQVY